MLDGSGSGRGGGGVGWVLEGVDDAGLPCLDLFHHLAVFEVEFDGDLAQGGQPGEFAGLFERLEAGGVAGLEGAYFGGEGEGFGMQGGPEEAG